MNGSVEEIINVIFGGQIDASKIIAIIVFIWSIVKSITEWAAKKKLITKEVEETKTQKDIKALEEKNKNLCKCVSLFTDALLTAYLSSNTISPEVKQIIGSYGQQLKCIGEIDLTEQTNKLINEVTKAIPNETLNEKKEEIKEEVKTVNDTVKKSNDAVQEAINKIKVS